MCLERQLLMPEEARTTWRLLPLCIQDNDLDIQCAHLLGYLPVQDHSKGSPAIMLHERIIV